MWRPLGDYRAPIIAQGLKASRCFMPLGDYKGLVIAQLASGELSEKRWILGTKWRPVGSPRRQSVTAWAFLMRMVGIWTQNGRFLGSNVFGKPIVPCTQGCQMSSKVRVGSTGIGIDAMGGIATRGQAARRRFQHFWGSGGNHRLPPLLDVFGVVCSLELGGFAVWGVVCSLESGWVAFCRFGSLGPFGNFGHCGRWGQPAVAPADRRLRRILGGSGRNPVEIAFATQP